MSVSYGNSKKWIAPGFREKQKHAKLNTSRDKICPRSPFWDRDMDLETHKREYSALLKTRLQTSEGITQSFNAPHTPPRKHLRNDSTTSSLGTPSRFAFSGKHHDGPVFTSNLSPVLALPTIFTPYYKLGRPCVAPWPSKSEMKYEGDERIATDKIHGRFLGAPRVEGNETVNWQHRNVIEQYQLENFHQIPTEATIIQMSHYVDEADHATDEEAKHMLGSELFGMLDPIDRF